MPRIAFHAVVIDGLADRWHMRTWPLTFHGEKVEENKRLLTSAQHLPFDSNTCEVNLMANGKSLGTTGSKAFSAKLPRSNRTV